MPDPSETGARQITPVMEIQKSRAAQEVQEAKTQGRQAELMDQLQLNLRRLTERMAVDSTKPLSALDKRKSRNNAAVAAVRVLQGIKGEIVRAMPPTSQRVFSKLAEICVDEDRLVALAPYITKYLNQDIVLSRQGQSETSFEKDLQELEEKDHIAAKLLKRAVISTAEERSGLSSLSVDQIKEKFGEPVEPSKKTDGRTGEETDRNKRMRERFDQLREQLIESIKGIPIEDREKIQDAILRVKSASGQEEKTEKLSVLNIELQQMVARGTITPEQCARFCSLANQYALLSQDVYEDARRNGERSLSAWAKDRFGVASLTKKQDDFLDALNDPERLRAIFQKKVSEGGYTKPEGEIDFETFLTDLREIAEEVVSGVFFKKGEFFDHALNMMYEGQFYNVLIDTVRRAGRELQQLDPEFAKTKVVAIVHDLFDDPSKVVNPDQTGKTERPYVDQLSYEHETKGELGRLITFFGTSTLANLKAIYADLYDMEYIVDGGLGWEVLKKHSEHLASNHVDWLLRRDPDLSQAYNFYVAGLRAHLTITGRYLTSDFGFKDDQYNMDQIQRQAYFQLLAMHTRNGEEMTVGLEHRIARSVKLATGLAKGFTGEFWSALYSVSLPDRRKKVEGTRITEFESRPKSIYDTGVEIMLGDIFPSIVWAKFGIPTGFPEMRFLPQRREFDGKRIYRDDHTKIYQVRDEYIKAMEHGASDWFLEFTEEYLTLEDFLKIKSIDTLARGSWRADHYRAYLVQTSDGRLDINRTLINLMKTGTYALKAFLDDLGSTPIFQPRLKEQGGGFTLGVFDEVLTDDGCIMIMGEKLDPNKIYSWKEKEKILKALQRRGYEQYIFERSFKIRPTSVVGWERRLYTPEGEVLISERLRKYLLAQTGELHAGLINNQVFHMYMAALGIAERVIFERKKGELEAKLKADQARGAVDYLGNVKGDIFGLLDYEFTEADLQDPAVRIAVANYLRESKDLFGNLVYNGEKCDLNFLTEERFGRTLTGFLREIQEGIKDDKGRRRVADPLKKERKGQKYATTLAQRFTHWAIDLKILEYDIGADDLDLAQFSFMESGSRMKARLAGEVDKWATDVIKGGVREIIEHVFPKICLTPFGSAAEVTQFTEQNLVPLFSKAAEARRTISGEEGEEFVVRMTTFLASMVGKDPAFRVMGIGSLFEQWQRNWLGRQSSYGTDTYTHEGLERPTTSLTGDQEYAMMKTILSNCATYWKKDRGDIIGYDELKIFGLPIGKVSIRKDVKWAADMALKARGHSFHNKLIERIIPIAMIMMILILYQLFKASQEKDKKR